MNYTPKHQDNRMRLIYGCLIVCAFVFLSTGEGLIKTILMSLGMICLSIGLFLFIRHDLTSYSYIVLENEDRLDFYISKVTGRRGYYVCYYPLSDAVLLEKYEKGKKKELYDKYGKVFVYTYAHNKFSGEKYILMFKNDGYYDAVVCQLDQKSFDFLQNAIKVEREKKMKRYNEEEDEEIKAQGPFSEEKQNFEKQ